MSTSIYVVFYLITCLSTEIHLGFRNARTDQVEYSNVSDNFGIFKMTTGSIVKAGDNETVEVNLGTNTILCSKDFDKFRSLEYKGCFFKFGVEVGVGESIESAPLV
jgi:hypothetical protein